MSDYQPGDIVLIAFPFSDGAGSKRRPALVIRDTGDDDVIVARVTSQSSASVFDVELAGWQQAGLLLPSIVRVHKLATLEKHLVERRLGLLTMEDRALVRAKLRELLARM